MFPSNIVIIIPSLKQTSSGGPVTGPCSSISRMDAHTLNAWTRFALQKGGIGSCTALVDNPATDLEDLMFMTGEKIIVLRRLDEYGNDLGNGNTGSGSANRRRSGSLSDENSWFLVSLQLRCKKNLTKLPNR